MIKCPFCQATHVDNTVFCNDCGSYLLDDGARETDALDTDEINWIDESGEPHQAAAPLEEDSPVAVRLKIGQGKREIEALLSHVTHIIGRVDPVSNVFPEIDLTDDGQLAKSVSRRHARILKQKDTVLVEDLGSINGTFINGKKLQPYVPEILHDGDTLQLGKISIEVSLRS